MTYKKNAGSKLFSQVTDIKQAVRNPNRVNVFVDGKYAFSLDIAQLVDFKLKIGQDITAQQLAECKKASEFGKLYQRALEWVLMRPRSEKEVGDYLYRKLRTYAPEHIDEFKTEIIQRLLDKGYVDDNKFATYYVENRFVKKGVSQRRLTMELMQKGIKREIIDEVLKKSERKDEEEIKKIIKRKWGKMSEEKIIQYLCHQGFSFELARSLVRSYETDLQN